MSNQEIVFPAVSVRHKTFGIDVPSITLKHGEILGIFGKSGSGKTTYLKRVREQFAPERILYMSQFDSLLEEITIRQNMELGLACTGKPATSLMNWEKEYAGLLEEFEVDRHMNKLPRMMSGGQRKRAEIVRCLMMNPEILLLDEPFQGIGHLFESVSTKHLLARADSGKGVTVIVSHDFDLLCRFSKRILLVDEQGVIEIAPTSEPGWAPRNVRAAWTLGVDNLIPAGILNNMSVDGMEKLQDKRMLAFWGRNARWGKKEGSLSLTVKQSDIGSTRTFLRHGEMYTQIETTVTQNAKPLLLVGGGAVDGSSDVTLSVNNHWIIDNDEKGE